VEEAATDGVNVHELQQGVAERQQRAVALLEQAIRGLEEEMADKERPNHSWTVADTPEGEIYFETPSKPRPTRLVARFFSFMAATTRQKTRLLCSCAQSTLSRSFFICGQMAADTY
jgi:hypothetical protein